MSTDIKPSQITLSDEGKICFQPNETNPLPGDAIAQLVKGESIYAPQFEMMAGAPLSQDVVSAALEAHLQANLPVFYKLTATSELPQPVQDICAAVYESFGMAAREDLQDTIAQLDTDMRTIVRNKGIRLGPLYLFCPEMNKPAALRLRALLWGVDNGMDLPVTRMPDGMVSKKVDSAEAPLAPEQTALYKALCYPVYGGRAIRIDMLDRVVNAIYDSADKGKFQAQHAMAEWMGCPIAELYAILEALGHKKVHDPADEVAEDTSPTKEETAEEKTEAPVSEDQAGDAQDAAKPNTDNIKPELATFALKRGKAYQKSGGGQAQKPHAKKDKPAFKKGKKPHKGKKPKDQGPRVISAGPDKPSQANSPFAVLGQLKK